MKNNAKKLHLAAQPGKATKTVARIARRALEDGLFLPRNREAREQVLAQERDERERRARHVAIFDRFPLEQQIMIGRIGRAGGFDGRDVEERDDRVIVTLASAALYVFQLDPFARDSFDRISKAAGTDKADGEVINSCINEVREAAEVWTLAQRAEELEDTPRGAKAEGARA